MADTEPSAFLNLLVETAHNDLESHPESSCHQFRKLRVMRASRIQNTELWQLFCAKRRAIREELRPGNFADPLEPPLPPVLDDFEDESRDLTINECFLFHGTTPENAMAIAREGFDERVSKGRYGYGSYFTSESCKAGKYAPPDSSGTRCILLARVVLGRIHYTSTSCVELRRPPLDQDGNAHHSVVANPGEVVDIPQFHREMIIFDGDQSFPELLLEVRTEVI
jgi:hypothetical protein